MLVLPVYQVWIWCTFCDSKQECPLVVARNRKSYQDRIPEKFKVFEEWMKQSLTQGGSFSIIWMAFWHFFKKKSMSPLQLACWATSQTFGDILKILAWCNCFRLVVLGVLVCHASLMKVKPYSSMQKYNTFYHWNSNKSCTKCIFCVWGIVWLNIIMACLEFAWVNA